MPHMWAFCRFLFALALVLGLSAEAAAEEWGGISPGVSTMKAVRERFGAPSARTRQKVEGYDTVRWIYEGPRAPAGMKRMTVEFGMLVSSKFKPQVVRYFMLEPKPRVFTRALVLRGWGPPDAVDVTDGRQSFFYTSGLLVALDPTGEDAQSLLFSVPQPVGGPAPR